MSDPIYTPQLQGGGGGGSSRRPKRKASEKFPYPREMPPAIPIEWSAANERFPMCVVWTPLPIVTWIFPFIGHVGICDSYGRVHDFQGSYAIGVDRMLFGAPVKYMDLTPDLFPYMYDTKSVIRTQEMEQRLLEDVKRYDEGLANATAYFRQNECYNFFTNNCHSFVSRALEMIGYGTGSWNMMKLCVLLAFKGRYTSWKTLFLVHLPSFVIAGIVATIIVLCTRRP